MIGLGILLILGALAVAVLHGSAPEFFQACGCFFFGIFIVFALAMALALLTV